MYFYIMVKEKTFKHIAALEFDTLSKKQLNRCWCWFDEVQHFEEEIKGWKVSIEWVVPFITDWVKKENEFKEEQKLKSKKKVHDKNERYQALLTDLEDGNFCNIKLYGFPFLKKAFLQLPEFQNVIVENSTRRNKKKLKDLINANR